MTDETFKLMVQHPELLNKIDISELRTLSARAIKDLPEPKLLVSEPGAFGVTLAVVFPYDDYVQLHDAYCVVMDIVKQMQALCGEGWTKSGSDFDAINHASFGERIILA